MHFKKFQLKHWQQFEEVDINFHDRLTIITGSNGCGKTTILNLLARHAGWDSLSLSTPKKDIGTGGVKFFTRMFGGKERVFKILCQISIKAPIDHPIVPQNESPAAIA